jgi:hypothetical protein
LRRRGHRCRPAGQGGGSPRPTVARTCKCSTYVFWRFFLTVVENIPLLCSAASDVNPDQAAEQGTAAPVAAAEDAAPQVTEQPAAAAGAEDQSAPASAATSTQPRGEEAARVPPPSTVVEEESRVPTPPAEEGRVLTPPRAGASSPVGSSGLD